MNRASPEHTERLFSALTDKHQKHLVSRLESEVTIIEEAIAQGDQITDSPKLLWRYLRRLGYTPASDLFGGITDTDIVELYGLEQMHLFQNLNFFDWVSVTLEQLYCETWYQNSTRAPEFQQQLAEVAMRVYRGETDGSVYPGIPWHVVRENGVDAFEFDFHIKCLSPVRLDGQIAGAIAVCEAKGLRSSRV